MNVTEGDQAVLRVTDTYSTCLNVVNVGPLIPSCRRSGSGRKQRIALYRRHYEKLSAHFEMIEPHNKCSSIIITIYNTTNNNRRFCKVVERFGGNILNACVDDMSFITALCGGAVDRVAVTHARLLSRYK